MTDSTGIEAVRAEHRSICAQLNIDSQTEERSWNSYLDIRNSYSLDGKFYHWLCCALYVTCRKTVTPTVGDSNSVLQGNCVSLTQLLRLCHINFVDFFAKIRQWSEMASLPEEDQRAIEHLRHSLSVSVEIYNRYNKVFGNVFQSPNSEEQKRSKKSKPQPCSANRLYEFCWLLFICAKAEYPEQSADLVTSYYMLLCCLDLIFANIIADNRRDIVNPEFKGLPVGFVANGTDSQQSSVCIIEEMCEADCFNDVINTRDTIWKQVIEKFFQRKILRGNAENCRDLLDVKNFDDNLKSLNSLYNRFILSCGEFDERIVLGQEIARAHVPVAPTPEQNPLCRQTPLTGRNRLGNNEGGSSKFTPISTANASVHKLRTKLKGYNGEPQASLKELFKSSAKDPTPVLRARIEPERRKFVDRMILQHWNEAGAIAKWQMIEALYYLLLENIVRAELRRRPNDLSNLCEEDMFNKTLLVCSAEIVIYAHSKQMNFPWILKLFDLQPFFFYRIIEIVILNHIDLLTHDIIKHLTSVEEQCVESLSWTSSSPLWNTMERLNYKIPLSQEVEIASDLSGITPHKTSDSVTKMNGTSQLESTPSTSTATPAAGVVSRKIPNPASAKKKLFKTDEDEEESKPGAAVSSTDVPEADQNQELPKETVDTTSSINQQPPFATGSLQFNSPLKLPVPNGSVSKRKPGTSSLSLFFRKFFSLAAVRMKHLCGNLNLSAPDTQRQIWTLFEYSITHRARELMRNRHLDQMLMCAIYVFVKIKKLDTTFTDIMKFYRLQPQWNSNVYRSVFIAWHKPEQIAEQQQQQQQDQGAGGNRNEEEHRVQPSELAGISVKHGSEERGDIIRFYNTVYVKIMQDFAIRFGNIDERSLVFSPLPKVSNRNTLLSPKQVDSRISLYVTPMDKKIDLKDSPNALTFVFDRSPNKDLERFNRIVKNSDGGSCKRSLSDPDSYDNPMTMKVMRAGNRKMDRLISDRQQQESDTSFK